MEGMIGEIRMFAGNFAPKSWSYCQGQLIAISSNTALYSILGTTYGGNGTTNFALPNLSSRVAIGTGQGPGLSFYSLGQVSGTENVTLELMELPIHTHAAQGNVAIGANSNSGGDADPTNGYVSLSSGDFYAGTADSAMGPSPVNVVVQPAGGTQPHSNLQPYLGMNYVVCLYGIYPSRP